MSRREIVGIFRWGRHWMPHGLNLRQKLWWRFMPGTVINVRWPTGETRIKQEPSGIWDYVKSADPNDHYRPWMEQHVGRQGWDWDWGMGNLDATENRLTIKFRRGREHSASVAALRWS